MNNINKINDVTIKNTKFGNLPKEGIGLEDNLTNLKNNMLKRCQYEISNFGDFAPIKEYVTNSDKDFYAGNMELVCEASEDNPIKRYLNYNQYNKENRKGLSSLIASGTNEDIIEKLNDKNFVNDIKQTAERMSDKMKKMRW